LVSDDLTVTGNVADLNIVSNVNMLHTSNTASIKLNSNVVTEFPRSKKLMKFPRVALTQNALNNGYSIVQSPASISGTETRKAWSLFNGVTVGGGGNTYHGNDGTAQWDASGIYTGSESLGGVSGTWLYIRLPVKISLEFVKLTSRAAIGQRTPRSGTFLGSNDAVNWTILSSFSDTVLVDTGSSDPEHTYTYNVNSTVKYEYIGFVVERIGHTYPNFEELEYFGIPEYDPEANGVDVVVKSVPNVPNTDWLEVYYDGQDYTSMPTTVTDKSGNNRTGTPSGVGFDTEYKAFTFDGSNDYIVKTGLPTPTGAGNFLLTVSVWFKVDSLAAAIALWGMAGETDGTDGSPSSYSVPHATIGTSGTISWAMWGDDINSGPGAIQINRWHHCVWTYSGGTTGRRIILDGVEQNLGTQSQSLNMVNTTSRLTLGIYPHNLTSNPLPGSIANFRLFNRALSTDEIYQLYAYQKEYFGHGTLGMTLKAGRLGIGTSEPRAALDVRGRILREYNPGEVIEELNSICDGSTVVVQSGSYDMADVTTGQDGTNSYATITGSTIIYTPPPGTKRVYYRFWYHWQSASESGISHHKIQVDGNDIYGSASTIASNYSTPHDHAHFPVSLEYTMNCNVGADNVNAGQFTSWTGPKTIRVMFREYNGSSYQCQLHQNGWWDGTAPPPANYLIMKPHLTIRAIA